MGILFIHKVRNKWKCVYCKSDIPNGAYCVADDERRYFKMCMSCAVGRIDSFIIDLKTRVRERVKNLKNLKRKILRNKGKYDNNNAVAVMRQDTAV